MKTEGDGTKVLTKNDGATKFIVDLNHLRQSAMIIRVWRWKTPRSARATRRDLALWRLVERARFGRNQQRSNTACPNAIAGWSLLRRERNTRRVR
jgi:hypothetical protein